MSQYFSCPNCGEDVPLKAKACPECGSDDQTGWSEAAKYTHLLPYTGDSATVNHRFQAWQKFMMAAIAVFLLVLLLEVSGLGWAIPAIAIASLFVGTSYFLYQKFVNSSSGMERKLYLQMVNRAGGDRELVQRLIDYESGRTPDAGRLQLLQNAIYRWDRDRPRI